MTHEREQDTWQRDLADDHVGAEKNILRPLDHAQEVLARADN
jgi:hypothetical protein